jgi:uncharacterized linocin/CFP29 family protein
MQDRSEQVGWSDTQWTWIRQAISIEVNKARVAGSFLPVYGPLPPSTQVVPSERLDTRRGAVDDVSTTRIVEVAVEIDLTQPQVREEELSSALLLFRRAANIIARMEDWIIFNGVPDDTRQPNGIQAAGRDQRWGYRIQGGDPETRGMLEDAASAVTDIPLDGEQLVPRIVQAVTQLERAGHLAPFACVLGMNAFVVAHTPAPGSLVLPRDRIEPVLERQLLRSSTIDDRPWEGESPPARGVVVALAGNPIDVALAVDAAPQFLYVNAEARYVFRVYERFALRIKEPEAIVRLEFEPKSSQRRGKNAR